MTEKQVVPAVCVKCNHSLMPDCPLDDLGRCQVRTPLPDGDADSCGCKCEFPVVPETSEIVDLKPCPFAHKIISGVGLNLWEEDATVSRIIGGAWQSVVECYDCHATGEPFSVPNKYDSVANNTAAYRAKKAWNTRCSAKVADPELWNQLSEAVEYIRNNDVHDAALRIIKTLRD